MLNVNRTPLATRLGCGRPIVETAIFMAFWLTPAAAIILINHLANQTDMRTVVAPAFLVGIPFWVIIRLARRQKETGSDETER
ncbi:hypothetical protein F4X86_02745 [Candidatus Saccharibacteria bacterium]|nr:hypothetical protein [Candidatus Saccharibacteria bacterium]